MWAGKSVEEAHDVLVKPDVIVTNQSDKDEQLAKIDRLDDAVKEALTRRGVAPQQGAGGGG